MKIRSVSMLVLPSLVTLWFSGPLVCAFYSANNKQGIEITKYTFEKKGGCLVDIIIEGNGLRERFNNIHCSYLGATFFPTDSITLVGDPEVNDFVLYTDDYGSLYVITNSKCVHRVYKNYKLSWTSQDVSKKTCDQVKENIKNIFMNKHP